MDGKDRVATILIIVSVAIGVFVGGCFAYFYSRDNVLLSKSLYFPVTQGHEFFLKGDSPVQVEVCSEYGEFFLKINSEPFGSRVSVPPAIAGKVSYYCLDERLTKLEPGEYRIRLLQGRFVKVRVLSETNPISLRVVKDYATRVWNGLWGAVFGVVIFFCMLAVLFGLTGRLD